MEMEAQLLEAVNSGDVCGVARIMRDHKQSPAVRKVRSLVAANVPQMVAAHARGEDPSFNVLTRAASGDDAMRVERMGPMLLDAAKAGVHKAVAALLMAGATADATSATGETALFFAASHGHERAAEYLLAFGASVEIKDKNGSSVLMVAAAGGFVCAVQKLLAAGAEVDHANKSGDTALVLAAMHGHSSVVETLLVAGADARYARPTGWITALYLAAQQGHSAIVATLLKAGASADQADSNGDTPLLLAASLGHTGVVETLLKAGAKVDFRDGNGNSGLMLAVGQGHTGVVRVLLEAGAEPTCANNQGRTPLKVSRFSDPEIADLLRNFQGSVTAIYAAISQGQQVTSQNVVAVKDACGFNGRTPLHFAAKHSRVELVRELVQQGADIHARDANGWTALHYASEAGNVEIVETLLSRGSKLDVVDTKGRSPVMLAAAQDYVTVVHKLHRHGASLKVVSTDGRSVMHYAAGNTKSGAAVVEYLVAADKQPNTPDRKKATPLHCAARAGNVASITALISHGAQVNAQDADGETALFIASTRGDAAAVQTLVNQGAEVGIPSVTGENPLTAAWLPQVRSTLQLYYNREHYYERCTTLMSAVDVKPTHEQLLELVPLITSVDDLRLMISLVSLTFDGEPSSETVHRPRVLKTAFNHIISNKLVFDDHACVFFKLVLEHCQENAWLPRGDIHLLDRQAEKVNTESAEWVIELQKKVQNNSWRLDGHEQSLRRVVDGLTQVHTMVLENRKAVKAVRSRVGGLQSQVDEGKKLMGQLIAHGNQISDHVSRLQERLAVTETNLVAVAEGFQNFKSAYAAREEQELKNRKIKMIGGLVASVAGLVFAPMLKEAFDVIVDLTNPVEIFDLAFGNDDIFMFLAESTNEHVLPMVAEQLEKLMIPVDEFETLLREEIALQHPEMLEECARRGLTMGEALGDSGNAEYAKSLEPSLASEAASVASLVNELQLAVIEAQTKSDLDEQKQTRPSFRSDTKITQLSGSNNQADDTKPARPVIRTRPHSNKTDAAKAKSPVKSSNVPTSPARPEGLARASRVQVRGPAVDSKPAKSPPQEPSQKTGSESQGEEIVFVDDVSSFPFHTAIQESNGQVNDYCELLEVLAGDGDDPNAVMSMRVRSSTTSEESLCAAEYAYCLGYEEVGDLLASRMDKHVTVKTRATSVTLLEDDEGFAFVSIVDACDGDADECEMLLEAIEEDDHAIDARIQARVVRESNENVKWTAAEYAASLGYLEIVKHVLKDSLKDLPAKTKIQLIKQAKSGRASMSDLLN